MFEAELIEKAQHGDRNAFRRLMEEWQGFVYSVAFRFVGNRPDAEDLVQETFIRLWNNLNRYNPQLAMKPWLGRIVTNVCLDYLKSSKVKQMRRSMDLKNAAHSLDSQNSEIALDALELQQVIRKLASQLTPRQQAVFVLRDLEDLEVEEVTQALEISSDVVKSNLYHARSKIREGLVAFYGEKKFIWE